MIASFPNIGGTQDTRNQAISVATLPLQYVFSVEPVERYKPTKPLEFGHTFIPPNPGEGG